MTCRAFPNAFDFFYVFKFQLDRSSFDELSVPSHNYGEVQSLLLDGNAIEALPGKLLDMALSREFSARGNKLTAVSERRTEATAAAAAAAAATTTTKLEPETKAIAATATAAATTTTTTAAAATTKQQ